MENKRKVRYILRPLEPLSVFEEKDEARRNTVCAKAFEWCKINGAVEIVLDNNIRP